MDSGKLQNQRTNAEEYGTPIAYPTQKPSASAVLQLPEIHQNRGDSENG